MQMVDEFWGTPDGNWEIVHVHPEKGEINTYCGMEARSPPVRITTTGEYNICEGCLWSKITKYND